jgi:hypothetical protein
MINDIYVWFYKRSLVSKRVCNLSNAAFPYAGKNCIQENGAVLKKI